MSGTASKDAQSAAPTSNGTEPVDASKLHLLVYSFLLQNNHGRTAQAFARTSGLATSGHLLSETTPLYLSSLFSGAVADSLQMSSGGRGKGKADGSMGSSGRSSGSSGRKDSAVVERTEGDVKSGEAGRCVNELVDHHIEYLRIRQSICSSIEDGEPKVALDLLSTYFRAVLIPPPSELMPTSTLPTRAEFEATLLRFRLDTQYYVELISNHQELEALKFGQRTLWRYPDIFDTWLGQLSIVGNGSSDYVPREEIKMKRLEIMQHITNVAALVAYPDPKKSTLAYLLEQERRDELAKAVNAAILDTMGFPKEPSLVTLVRQLATTSAYLVGYRSSSSSSSAGRSGGSNPDAIGSSTTGRHIDGGGASASSIIARQQQQQQPWVLDTFINSEPSSDSLS